MPAYMRLLKDTEAEVRTAGANQLPGFCAFLNHHVVIADILPSVKDMTVDSSQHVRAALANHITGLAPVFGKQSTIDHLLPLFLQLLKDEASEVRLNIISKLDGVNQGTIPAFESNSFSNWYSIAFTIFAPCNC